MKPVFDGCLKDYRDDVCAICGEDCNPHIRHLWGMHHPDVGDIVDLEVTTCQKCATKVTAGWKNKLR